MSITDVLVAEHVAFAALFDQMQASLPACRTVAEVALLARLVEGVLRHHGEAEEHLVLTALDHLLAERGQLDALHHEHQELDQRLRQVGATADLPEARRRLMAVLTASRKHFRGEERDVFPRIERVLQPDSLARLGEAFLQHYRECGSPPRFQCSQAA